MTRARTWSAPGKVLWAGEYAVLDGAPALVTAVARRAVARVGDAPVAQPSPFLAAAQAELAAAYGPESPAARAAARVTVDSSALAQAGTKLGLGSSAAATVSAVAAALAADPAHAALPPERFRALVHRHAHRAHGTAQAPRGARGSGADVAASVHGGVLAVVRPAGADDLTPLEVRALALPAGLTPVLVWTGQAADTPTLVAAVRAFAERDPAGHAAARAGLAAAARSCIAAFEAGDPAAAVAALAGAADALAELGARAGCALVPEALAPLAALARAHGGAAKPTGAGGGDQILAVFPAPAAADAFAAAARAAGNTLVDAPVDLRGVALDDSPFSE
jgi:phosphomevalonate kinase